MERTIKRDEIINEILKYAGTASIKVLMGIRRSGKSTILKMIKDYFAAIEGEESCLFFNFESIEHVDVDTRSEFASLLKSTITSDTKHIFLDEVQYIKEWEKVVNAIFSEGIYDIYITGSNSKLLSGELGTLLSGRFTSFTIQTLSFREILLYEKNYTIGEYLKRGGFPAVVNSKFSTSQAWKMVDDIYNSIVYKDIIERFEIRNVDLLKRLLLFVMQNLGNTFSAKSISDYLKSQNRSFSTETIYEYLDHLEDAYILQRVSRIDVIGKETLKTLEKYYFADHSIVNSHLNYESKYISGILENVVYSELIRRGYSVGIGKLKDREIDFLATKRGRSIYIQVAYLMEEDATFEREISVFSKLKDKNPCYIITLDESRIGDYDGVKCVSLEYWLKAVGRERREW